ncbi:hypothetical protein B296_00022041 [Ensete ventricosum]|uniref:Uncharacterized protein n=1 Tax=Ensete ventricosum TaxID=4639 RepID=A0A426Z1D2_ENSVE|nr:hypothetical protein B296_00022041 [Ensete ventricosum]
MVHLLHDGGSDVDRGSSDRERPLAQRSGEAAGTEVAIVDGTVEKGRMISPPKDNNKRGPRLRLKKRAATVAEEERRELSFGSTVARSRVRWDLLPFDS